MACLRPTHQHIRAVLWVTLANSTQQPHNLHRLQSIIPHQHQPAQTFTVQLLLRHRPMQHPLEPQWVICHPCLIMLCPTPRHHPTMPVQHSPDHTEAYDTHPMMRVQGNLNAAPIHVGSKEQPVLHPSFYVRIGQLKCGTNPMMGVKDN